MRLGKKGKKIIRERIKEMKERTANEFEIMITKIAKSMSHMENKIPATTN